MDILFIISLLLCATGEVSGQFQLEPANAVVLQGSEVQFNTSLKGQWNIMTWNVQDLLVLTIYANTGPISFLERFSARNCSSVDTSCWEFTIHNVSRNDAGPVICTVQGLYGERRAELHVQESGTVDIPNGNVRVEQDQRVEFQCVTSAWFPEPTISWVRNGDAVNGSLFNTTVQAHGDSFNSTSVLTFQAVSNTTVECLATVQALASPLSSSVYLVVVPKPTDWTVLIAVVVSIGSFALLVLLILGIIFCYKQKKEKESRYQDQMRRTNQQSQISTVVPRQGQVNLGYVTHGQTSATPSEFDDSGFSQTNGSNILEIPDVVNENQTANGYNGAYNTLDGPGVRKHRHVTIV